MLSAIKRAQSIINALPSGGLFQGKEWLISPDAFPIDAKTYGELDLLGNALHAFNRSCNQLYRESAMGSQPTWIAELLDQGKPQHLIDFTRSDCFAEMLPSVLRPDVILTDDEFCVAELDSLPGGIGVTAWMNQVYGEFDDKIVGGEFEMIDGFARLLDGGDVIISEEAQDYKPEMLWLMKEIAARNVTAPHGRVIDTANVPFGDLRRRAYRYFELWDLDNIENASALMKLAQQGEIVFTPPFKPYMEEKLWLALFWSGSLREYWKKALGDLYFEFLNLHIPQGWVVDPAPIPPFGEIPGLNVNSWDELGRASQKDRHLVLKISGFSETAWGSRGVHIGHDTSSHEWQEALKVACDEFEQHPYILQRFRKGKLVKHSYYEKVSQSMREMNGRVRLCPYYFIEGNEAKMSGIMATICPADKKLLHGMTDAIITPCTLA